MVGILRERLAVIKQRSHSLPTDMFSLKKLRKGVKRNSVLRSQIGL
jgi:hypothetical protein